MCARHKLKHPCKLMCSAFVLAWKIDLKVRPFSLLEVSQQNHSNCSFKSKQAYLHTVDKKKPVCVAQLVKGLKVVLASFPL